MGGDVARRRRRRRRISVNDTAIDFIEVEGNDLYVSATECYYLS